MTYVMGAYDNLLAHVLEHGEERLDRTGTGTLTRFGAQMRFDLRLGFPAVTKKFLNFDVVVKELCWFLRGETNTKTLGAKIWDQWAEEDGDIGPSYGEQFRAWEGADGTKHDQIENLIQGITSNPFSRRHIVSAWNVGALEHMALPPCHTMFQVYVSSDGNMDLHLYQRSGDMFLGVPFNIASYSLLLSAVAHVTGYVPRYFVHTVGDAHIYLNHKDQAAQYLKQDEGDAPTLVLGEDVVGLLDILKTDGLEEATALSNYVPGPKISAPVAI